LIAFFQLSDLSEQDKVIIAYTNISGRALDYLGPISRRNIKCLDELDDTLRVVFSDRIKWNSKFLNCVQETDESFRSFAIRLNVAGGNSGVTGIQLEEQTMDLLKRNSLPEFRRLLSNILPGTKSTVAIEHGIAYEQNKLQNNKRKIADSVNLIDDDVEIESKRTKKNYTNDNYNNSK